MRYSFSDLSLRYKILIPFLFTVISLALVAIFFNIRSARSIIKRAGQEQVQDSVFTLTRGINEALNAATNLVVTLSEISRLQAAIAENDRNKALKVLTPILEKINNDSKLKTEVHIHTADGHSFLRSWAPNRYGDDLTLTRPMIAKIIRNKQVFAGIEAGRGGLFLRAIAPVYYRELYVGSIETGIPLKELFQILSGEENAIQALLKPEIAKIMNKKQKVGNLILATSYKELPPKVLTTEILNQGLSKEKIILFKDYGIGLKPIKNFEGKTIGVFVVGRDLSDLEAVLKEDIFKVVIVFSIASILAIMVVIWLANIVRSQICLAATRMEDIAQGEGDLTKELPVLGKDEVGSLSQAFNTFLTKLKKIVIKLKEQVQNIYETSGHLDNAAHALEDGISVMEKQTSNISNTSEVLVKRTEEVHRMISEMEQAISEISQQTATAASIAAEAQEQIQNVIKTFDALDKGSQEIGEVVNFINSIADQTNLLALNATIEAARAGEAGKGFAVVANEVKDLAKQTSEATEDISKKVYGIQASSKQVVEAIERISKVIERVNEVSNTIAAAVEEQTATVSGISENMNDVASKAEGLSKLVPEMQKAAELVRESMEGVKKQRERLASLSKNMKILVNQFKT
ncbi:methyl-accepting chemotaxis protein [Thermodesulfatator atlanticus]